MSDLISRSKVISVLEQLEEHSLSGKMDISNAIYLLEKQPTAYSVGKVVEELEDRVNEANNNCLCEMHENGHTLDFENENGRIKGLKEAIDIVKQGSISDDVCEWKYNGTEYYWESSCEHLHIFMADGPKENEYDFCPYCGKKILCKE